MRRHRDKNYDDPSHNDTENTKQAANVLLIGSDQSLADVVTTVLEQGRFVVAVVGNKDTALELAQSKSYDVVIVDWFQPGGEELSVCQAVRAISPHSAVLVLAPSVSDDRLGDRLLALRSGADDCVTKPLATEELLARVRALARRFTMPGGQQS